MAERKYFNMKKDIHPDYRQVVFMDTTTGYQFLSGSTKHSNETVEFEGSHKQTDAWIVSTKNTVSNKQHLVVKPFRLEWLFCVLLGVSSPTPIFIK